MIRSLIKSSSYSSITSVLTYGLTIILARDEAQLGFAEFTYSFAWALIFTQIIDLAATQCLTHFKITSGSRLDVIITSTIGTKIAMLGIVLIVTFAINYVGDTKIPFTLVYFLVPAFYLGPVFEIRSRNVVFARILFVEKVALLLFCFFYLKFNSIDMVIYLAYFVSASISLGLQFLVLDVKRPTLSNFQGEVIRSYFSRYWAIYLTLASQVAYGHVSRVVIEAKLGILAFAGVSLALQIVYALKIVQTQLDRHLRPKVAEIIHASDQNAIRELTLNYVRLYLLPLSVACIFLYVFSDEIVLLLFGSKWEITSVYLRYLSPLVITIAILRYLDIFVVALELGRANLIINVFAAVVLISLLAQFPVGGEAKVYLLTIVAVQFAHICILCIYVLRKAFHFKEATSK